MIKTMKTPVSAVIDIGSGQVNLKIIQIPAHGEIQILESVTRSLPIGRDTFSTGRISPAMVDDLCTVLNGYRQLLKDYKIRTYRAVATSAFREAKNREYVIDQIRVKTGITIDILDNTEERYYTLLAVQQGLKEYESMRRKGGILVLSIGSGNLQISGYGKEGLEYNQSFQLGSLRIRQMLSSIEENSLQFPKALEEYVLTHIEQRHFHFANIAATGAIVDILQRVISKSTVIQRADFDKLYNQLLYMPLHTMMSRYQLDAERAEMVVPALIIIRTIWNQSQSDSMLCPACSMPDGILAEMNRAHLDIAEDALQNEILSHARVIAGLYAYDKAHVEDVSTKALQLFDKLAKSQGLTDRHRLLLQMAVIFHDTGKFINVTVHDKYSAMIVESSDLVGLSTEEQNMVSRIVRYHEDDELDPEDPIYRSMTRKNRTVTSKLIAILQLANAMDASHKQKLMDLSFKTADDTLRIRMIPKDNYLLEKWMFDRHTPFFHDVFGLKPELKVKRGNEK